MGGNLTVRKLFYTFFLLAVFSLVGIGTALADGSHNSNAKEPYIIEKDGYKIELFFDNIPLKTGKTSFNMSIFDKDLNKLIIPIVFNLEKVEGNVKKSEGHGESHQKEPHFNISQNADVYGGFIDITEKGDWNFNVTFNDGIKVVSIDFMMEVADSGPNLKLLVLMGNSMVLSMVAAAVIKKKRETGGIYFAASN